MMLLSFQMAPVLNQLLVISAIIGINLIKVASNLEKEMVLISNVFVSFTLSKVLSILQNLLNNENHLLLHEFSRLSTSGCVNLLKKNLMRINR
jgi:hypothetical protein